MMKLFERHTTREIPDSHPELYEDLPKLPEGVNVPDDIRDMEPPAKLTRSPRVVRWLHWVPVGLGLVAGGLLLAVVMSDAGTEPVGFLNPTELIEEVDAPWVEGEGPGSNSLNMPVVDATPWVEGEGPGSNSLNMPVVDATPWVEGEGPGSNSLNVPVVDATPWVEGEGPGSNSLNVTEP